MNTQPEALRLAKELVSVHQGHADEGPSTFSEAAVELCRLYELAQEQHTEIYGLRLKVRNLHSVNADLLEALKKRAEVDFAYAKLLVADIEEDTFQLLLDEIDDAEYAAKALSSAAIAKATGVA
jgi:hypothetical protein